MAGTDTATTEATAPVEPTPAEETNEEAFDEAFEEFAGKDDTVTAAPDPGPEKADYPQAGAEAPATTDDPAASGEESSDGATTTGEAGPQDIWADATPEQKAAFEAAQHENSSHRTRASAQNRKISELMSAPKPAAKPAADEAATTEANAAQDEAAENWKQFDGEYPEVAGPMGARMDRQDKENAELKAEIAGLKGQVTGITDGQIQNAIDSEEALLVQRHPDWEQLTSSEEFSAWLPNQARYVQEGFVRNGNAIIDGQEAASLIDLFKSVQEPTPEPAKEPGPKPGSTDTATNGKATRRQRRLESAVTSESGQAGPGAGPPEGDFDAAFEYFADKP